MFQKKDEEVDQRAATRANVSPFDGDPTPSSSGGHDLAWRGRLDGPSNGTEVNHNFQPNYELETDSVVLQRRQKQIAYGRNTPEYLDYINAVPKEERVEGHPNTPNLQRKYTRRGWDGLVRVWRRDLHSWDLLATPWNNKKPKAGAVGQDVLDSAANAGPSHPPKTTEVAKLGPPPSYVYGPPPSYVHGPPLDSQQESMMQELAKVFLSAVEEAGGVAEWPALELARPKFPHGDFFVRLVGVDQTGQIIVQVIDKDEWRAFRTHMGKLKGFLQKKGRVIPTEDLMQNRLVAYLADGRAYRGEVQRVEEGGVRMLNVDEVELVLVPLDHVFHIPPKALTMCARSIRCKLEGMDLLVDTKWLAEAFALVPPMDTTFMASLVKEDPLPVLRLVSLDGHSLTDLIRKEIPVACQPHYPKLAERIPVQVVYIDESGVLYFHREDDDDLMHRLFCFSQGFNYESAVQAEDAQAREYVGEAGRIFAAPDQTGAYFRCQVLEIVEEADKVRVIFIDFGNQEEVEIKKLVSVELMDANMKYIPPRALPFRLPLEENNIPFHRDLIADIIDNNGRGKCDFVLKEDDVTRGPIGDLVLTINGEDKSLLAHLRALYQ